MQEVIGSSPLSSICCKLLPFLILEETFSGSAASKSWLTTCRLHDFEEHFPWRRELKSRSIHCTSRPGRPAFRSIARLHTWGNKDDLPRVLFVGDSITRGYFAGVEEQLGGKAYCARLTTSKCVSDPSFNDDLLLLLKQYKFAAIRFNNGLHGWKRNRTPRDKHSLQDCRTHIQGNSPTVRSARFNGESVSGGTLWRSN
jgi:hypothetical protein